MRIAIFALCIDARAKLLFLESFLTVHRNPCMGEGRPWRKTAYSIWGSVPANMKSHSCTSNEDLIS